MPSTRSILTLFLAILMVGQTESFAQFDKFKIPPIETFISDTLNIEVPTDSAWVDTNSGLTVMDSRKLDDNIIGIRQTNKFKYIPVDQYLALNQPLADLFKEQFEKDSLDIVGKLHVSELILWWDGAPYLNKGLSLNAYTTFHDTLGQPVSDWLWEIRVEKEKKEEESVYLSRIIQEWIQAQSKVLKEGDFNPDFYPYLYRRQLMTWAETIVLTEGYAVNVHFTLDFPPDQEDTWMRGSPGIYYRKADRHESIAIGGTNQLWFKRLSPSWVSHSAASFRFGFNNFERGEFKHLSYENILFVNFSGMLSLDYRPVYHSGLFGGIGLYAGYSVLPMVVDQGELGVLLRLGVILP